MNVVSVRRGRTMKVVTLSDVGEVNDEDCLAAAFTAAGETRSSLFGWSVAYFDDDELGLTAVVTLHTD